MNPDRRIFLKLTAGVCWIGGVPAVWQARELIRCGGLGRVVFCRAPRNMAGWLPFLLDGASPVCERTETDELVLCGTEATLVVDSQRCRRFA